MAKEEKPVNDSKAKLKALREERKEIISKNRELLKKQNSSISLIKKGLKGTSKTIPELAKETGLKSDVLIYYVSAMKKYGEIAETGHSDAYLKYTLVEKTKSKKK